MTTRDEKEEKERKRASEMRMRMSIDDDRQTKKLKTNKYGSKQTKNYEMQQQMQLNLL